MVEILKNRLDELLEKEEWLICLEAAGVDNWDGISYAHEIQKEAQETLEKLQEDSLKDLDKR